MPIMATCRHCGKEFTVRPGTVGKYCSRACYRPHRQAKPAAHPKTCIVCGATFLHQHGTQRFCGTKCSFWFRVDKDGPVPAHVPELGPCWVWMAALNERGYGRFRIGRKQYQAHRLALEESLGHPLENHACHRCDNHRCVRPSHLFDGTQQENIRDMYSKGRGTHGDAREPVEPIDRPLRGSHGGRPKLDEAAVVKIRARRASGETAYALASEFGVSRAVIYGVVNRTSWRHV